MSRSRIVGNAQIIATVLILFLFFGLQPASAASKPPVIVPGVYTSETVTLPNGNEVDISLILLSEQQAVIIFSAADDSESLTAYGVWEIDDDNLLTVMLTSDDEEEYAEPWIFQFTPDGETLHEVDDEFSVTLAMTEAEWRIAQIVVGGVYASDALVTADGDVAMAVLYLREDGTAQGNINYFDGSSLPTVQMGGWMRNDDGTVNVLLVTTLEVGEEGVEVVKMDQSIERVYTIGEAGELIGEQITLRPLASVEWEDERSPLSFSSDVLTSRTTPGLVMTFLFYPDGTFETLSDYMNDEPPFVEYGVWENTEEDVIAVTVTGDQEGAWDESLIFSVEIQEDGSILAIEKDVFGPKGLILYPDEK